MPHNEDRTNTGEQGKGEPGNCILKVRVAECDDGQTSFGPATCDPIGIRINEVRSSWLKTVRACDLLNIA